MDTLLTAPCVLQFGKSFGFVRRGSDMDGFLQGVSNLSHWGSMAGWLPMVSQPLRVLLRRLSGEAGPEMIDRMTRPPIDARYRALEEKAREGDEDEEVRTDLLAKFIKSKDPKTGTRLTPHQVLTTAISVVGAGSDTTSTALTAFLGYLVRHPAVYAAVQSEIDDAAEKGQLRNGSDPVSYATGVKLPWLQACIKETLRLHPPISMSLPRIVPRGGAMIGDIFVPAGTHVSLSPYVFIDHGRPTATMRAPSTPPAGSTRPTRSGGGWRGATWRLAGAAGSALARTSA
ncbi:hypothetical protein L7F22_066502 [Adiantum nelumboides]|nr:hypothetical protein [Adiantum nelumboides]